MDDARWERYGALGGVVFVALDVVVGLVAGEPPGTGASRGEIVAYVTDHRPAIEAGLWLFGLAVMALVWWSGSLWRRMERAEAGRPRLAVVSVVGLTLAGAMSLAASAVSATLAVRIGDVGEAAVAFNTLAVLLLAASGFGVAVHVLATSVLGARTATMAPWLGGVGALSAVGFVASAILACTGRDGTSSTAGIVGFAAWCVWILGISWAMWRDLPNTARALTPSGSASR